MRIQVCKYILLGALIGVVGFAANFEGAVHIAVGGVTPLAVAIGDFNDDRRADLAVSYQRCDPKNPGIDPRGCDPNDRNGRVVLMLGQGGGRFEVGQRFVVGESPEALALADLNGDGHLDIAVANFGFGIRGSISILLGDGVGGMKRAAGLRLEGNAADVAVGDFNADGKADLAAAVMNKDWVAVALGDGKGGFSFPEAFGVGNAPRSLTLGDFNKDGKLDIASANVDNEQSISILLGDGKGGFAISHIALDDAPFDIFSVDLDNDGALDLVTAHAARLDSVVSFLGDGLGGFRQLKASPAGTDPIRLALADLNSDNKLDAVTVSGNSDRVFVLLGDGRGAFQAPASFGVGQGPVAVAAGDLNGDGKPDIVTANQKSHDVSILLNK